MLAMLALVVLAACLRECRASDDEDGGAESVGSVGSSLNLGLAVVWKDVAPVAIAQCLQGCGTQDDGRCKNPDGEELFTAWDWLAVVGAAWVAWMVLSTAIRWLARLAAPKLPPSEPGSAECDHAHACPPPAASASASANAPSPPPAAGTPSTRNIGCQAPCTYTWRRQQPRFLPLGEAAHGAFF